MKKWLILLPTAFIILSSCSSSSGFEKTIRKIAKLMCREKQLQRDIDNGFDIEKTKEELEKVKAEHEKLKNEVQEKYYKEDDGKMVVKAVDIYREEMKECH